MKEPELEAENLSAAIIGDEIRITRRTMAQQTPPVMLTTPSGKQVTDAADQGRTRHLARQTPRRASWACTAPPTAFFPP